MHTVLRTPTPDLAESVDFYRRLGFTVLQQGETVRISESSCAIRAALDFLCSTTDRTSYLTRRPRYSCISGDE